MREAMEAAVRFISAGQGQQARRTLSDALANTNTGRDIVRRVERSERLDAVVAQRVYDHQTILSVAARLRALADGEQRASRDELRAMAARLEVV